MFDALCHKMYVWPCPLEDSRYIVKCIIMYVQAVLDNLLWEHKSHYRSALVFLNCLFISELIVKYFEMFCGLSHYDARSHTENAKCDALPGDWEHTCIQCVRNAVAILKFVAFLNSNVVTEVTILSLWSMTKRAYKKPMVMMIAATWQQCSWIYAYCY